MCKEEIPGPFLFSARRSGLVLNQFTCGRARESGGWNLLSAHNSRKFNVKIQNNKSSGKNLFHIWYMRKAGKKLKTLHSGFCFRYYVSKDIVHVLALSYLSPITLALGRKSTYLLAEFPPTPMFLVVSIRILTTTRQKYIIFSQS